MNAEQVGIARRNLEAARRAEREAQAALVQSLREAKAAGVPQKDLAREVGASQQYVSKLLRG